MAESTGAKQKNTLQRFFTIFAVALIIILFTSTLVHEADKYAIFLFVLILLLGGLFAFCYRFMKQQDELTSLARFQTALFSAAARSQSAFYLILCDNETVEFTDPGFNSSFPNTANLIPQGLTAVLDSLQLPEEAQRTLNHAINTRQNAFLKETLVDGDSEGLFILSYEPLSKPDNYGVLRGRSFVERSDRKGRTEKPAQEKQVKQEQTASSNVTILADLPLEPFIANSPLAAACLDMNGKVSSSNASLRELTGTTDKPAGWQFIEAVHEDNRDDVTARLDSISNGSAEDSPLDVILTTGDDNSAMLYFSRFEQKNGNPQILLHLIDTTEQKSLEVKYAHAQKMQAVGQLAGGVAHDFNNLLTAMIGFCDLLLQRHPAGDESFADIMQVKQNANRAANLVRQLLAFSRRQTLQPKMLEMTDVIAELNNLNSPSNWRKHRSKSSAWA